MTDEQLRARRLQGYLDWLRDDVEGIGAQLIDGAGKARSLPDATVQLAEARELVALTLSRIDRLIEADRVSQHEQEPA
jgi:hypothetical protein